MAVQAIPQRQGIIVASGLLVTAAVAAGALFAAQGSTYDTWGALLVAPLILLISLPVLALESSRERDQRLFFILVFALILKLCAALARYYVAFDLYGGRADAGGYHEWGVRLAEQFRVGNFETGLSSLSRTNFIRFLTGIVYTIIGPSKMGGFLFFSWLGFLGLFFFYRAFKLAIPQGRTRVYAALLFFLPSLLFWPSSIGKEAWMMFALGLAAFGAGRTLSGSTASGLAIAAAGLWLAAIVRPHVARMMGLALAAAVLIQRSRPDLRQLAPIAKSLSLVAVAALSVGLLTRTDRFLDESGFDTGSGLTAVIEKSAERTGQGGSEFEPPVVVSPARLPLGIITTLFRPFIFEAHNDQSLLAAVEGSILLLLTLTWIFRISRAIRGSRRVAYVAFALVFLVVFSVGFSGVANFGILVRQRTQLLPIFLVLLTASAPRGPAKDRVGGRDSNMSEARATIGQGAGPNFDAVRRPGPA
jgi:hypothetical protein